MIRRFFHHLKQQLLPTAHNGFIPHLLREKQVWGMLMMGIVLFSFVQIARIENYFGLTAEVYPAVIVTLTNKDRATNNLATLSLNDTLTAAAKLKATDMAAKGYFAHTSPEGLTPWHWFGEAGYKFIYAGENLAINYSESDAVETAWLNSPTHRANIMNENFTEMGVATATGNYNGVETTFVVELFGMPATARVTTVSTPPTTIAPTAAPASTSVPVVSSGTAQPSALAVREVAGETVPTLTVLEETPTYSMVQNNDASLEPGNPATTPAPKVSWMKRLILNSNRIAGLIIQTIIIAAIIATTGMIAREYEKHHKKHMAYGVLLAISMFAALFVGRIGIFSDKTAPVATVSETVVLK